MRSKRLKWIGLLITGFAERINLTHVSPHNELASTKYCLAAPGGEYLIYLPDGGAVTVDLAASNVEFSVEWFDPNNRQTVPATSVTGGAWRELKAPFKGPAVLYLHSTK
jgi:hypothetical protein